MRLAPGVWFTNEFLLEERLGRGGAGEVWRVLHRPTQRRRALKILSDAVVRDPTAMRRFELEACVGGLIESPHLVDVISAGVDPESGRPWLLMEPLTGETLGDWIMRDGPVPMPIARVVLSQIAAVLGKAHAANVIHRDVKPPNVFIEHRAEGPFVRLLDFGVAKVMRAGTLTGEVGTPNWMAPEQMDVSTDVSPATDVWGFGLAAFYVLVGHHYWKSRGFEIVTELIHEPYVSASARASELDAGEKLPPGFDAWFARCVVRDSSARFADVSLAFEGLRPLLGSAPSTEERRVGAIDLGAQPPKTPTARRRWKIASFVSLGSIACAVALYFVFASGSRADTDAEDRASPRKSKRSEDGERSKAPGKGRQGAAFTDRETLDRVRSAERLEAAGIPFEIREQRDSYLASFGCNVECCTNLIYVDALTEQQFETSLAEYEKSARQNQQAPDTMANGTKGRTIVSVMSVASQIPPDPRCKASNVLSVALGK